jgi:histidine phosphotransfer protein HptB
MAEKLIDPQVFEELKSALGDDYIIELLDTWYEEAPKIMSEMRVSLSQNDSEIFRRSAHALKSNAASFGATHLAALCKELENLGRQQQLDQVGNKLDEVIVEYEKAVVALKGLSHG